MKNKIENLRKQIDEIDNSIVILLARRMEVVKNVGEYKKIHNISALDKKRWREVLKSKKGYLKKIWKIIHDEALKVERNIL